MKITTIAAKAFATTGVRDAAFEVLKEGLVVVPPLVAGGLVVYGAYRFGKWLAE